jgi:hypothetical protein
LARGRENALRWIKQRVAPQLDTAGLPGPLRPVIALRVLKVGRPHHVVEPISDLLVARAPARLLPMEVLAGSFERALVLRHHGAFIHASGHRRLLWLDFSET